MRECLTIRNLCKLLINLMFALCDIRLHVRYWGRAGCASVAPTAQSQCSCAFGLPQAPRMCDRDGALGESEGL